MNKFTLLDRAIGYFSPTAGLRRAQDRQLLNKYQAALPANPHTKKRNPRSTGNANQLNQSARALRERARFMDENNPVVTAILDELVVNVVGARGIMIEPQPLNFKGEVDVKFSEEISTWLDLFSLNQNIDAETTRSETEQLSCRTWLRDGEVFGRAYMGHHPEVIYPTSTPYAIQPFEPDFIPAHINEPERGLCEGIQRNRLGQAQNYLIQKDSLGFEFVEVAAQYMSHLKYSRRLHQNRGVTILHSVLDLIADIEDYDQSERISAQIASRFAYFIKRDAGIGEEAHQENDVETSLGYGNSFELAPGEDAGVIQSNRREVMSSTFRDSQLRLVSAGTGVNNSSVTRNYSGSYSAQRQELVDSFSRYGFLQRKFITGWTRPQHRQALSMAFLSGELKVPRKVDPKSVLNSIYQAPVIPWIDPKKEMEGIEKAIRMSLKSLSHTQRERNINPLSTRREIQAERNAMNEMGIVSTSDPAHNLALKIQQEKEKK